MRRVCPHASRHGTPVLYGMMWHILKNGWEDKEFIKQRVYGFDDLRKKSRNGHRKKSSVSPACRANSSNAWPDVCDAKASTLIVCMGQTQHTVGTANVRASCIALLMTGNVGAPVPAPISCAAMTTCRAHRRRPRYRDAAVLLRPGRRAWKHWSRVWEVDYNYLLGRFDDKKIMETPGIR